MSRGDPILSQNLILNGLMKDKESLFKFDSINVELVEGLSSSLPDDSSSDNMTGKEFYEWPILQWKE